jgi:hypothetical protein
MSIVCIRADQDLLNIAAVETFATGGTARRAA